MKKRKRNEEREEWEEGEKEEEKEEDESEGEKEAEEAAAEVNDVSLTSFPFISGFGRFEVFKASSSRFLMRKFFQIGKKNPNYRVRRIGTGKKGQTCL